MSDILEPQFTGKTRQTTIQAANDKWEIGRSIEYNIVKVDLRDYDKDGTLDVEKIRDKSSGKFIPLVSMHEGYLIIKLRRHRDV